ncbi:hypothetical protein GCM10022231_20760 [Gordonia caeni]|uniref:Uncharacterized protein n=1 Tax=Gordonia caeni TaxID=1007097 RepID=A0ABP7P6K9_9ACTN
MRGTGKWERLRGHVGNGGCERGIGDGLDDEGHVVGHGFIVPYRVGSTPGWIRQVTGFTDAPRCGTLKG